MTKSNYIQSAQNILKDVKGKTQTSQQRCQKAIELAALLLQEARVDRTYHEKKHLEEMSAMMQDPKGKSFISTLTDQCFRSHDPLRISDQLIYLLNTFGIPHFFSWAKRIQFVIFKKLGKSFSQVLVPLIKNKIRKETSAVIIQGESEPLAKYLQSKKNEGVRINLNHLGEAILGEEEAAQRLKMYLDDLTQPEIEYISVKISTLYSQLNLIATQHTLHVLSDRLKQLFRAAKANKFIRTDGSAVEKFVNLDMEEYRDLHLTIALFKSVLDEPEFHNHSAGIVLQSYLPDSFPMQKELTEWAIHRVEKGGAPIKIRIVKGANLAMEQVEASLKNWPQAPYTDKLEVDANFKRMLIYGCRPEYAKAVHLGIGSHNLFDIAFAMMLRVEQQIEPYVCFEMLEGMAEPLRRVVQKMAGDMLLYCPTATKEEFQYAVAYLVRRLDENTAPQNFLRHAFNLLPGSPEWKNQADLFSLSCERLDSVSSSSRRVQNRLADIWHPNESCSFENEPDTDWSIEIHAEWAKNIHKEWSQRAIATLPYVINGQEDFSGKEEIGEDPSNPGVTRYKYTIPSLDSIEGLLSFAQKSHTNWAEVSAADRSNLLAELARCLRRRRADLIGAMVVDGAKAIHEADNEVSEAIDFAEYYRRNIEEVLCLQDIRWQSKGVVLVAPPWNFPCSIPAGGIIAALAAGNSVVFKPAPETVLCGWILINCFWEAGFTKDLVQFFPCSEEPVGSRLIEDSRISAVILTGATQTAKLFLQKRPDMDLIAETGGKNVMIISRMSDRDLAVKDLIHSAFGHSGQKCSACSLAICEAEVYDDPKFRQTLKDAAKSLIVGNQWNLAARITPLVKSPNSTLQRALTTLEPGEEWLLKPHVDAKNPRLWSPGIKLGVKSGSFTYNNEFFGPVLGIMRAENLQEAIKIANGTPYGLTAGLHSLDEREQALWIQHIMAGNLYINRTMTGAIVQRQPFGGCKESNFGRGAKAGGPNYLMQLMNPEQVQLPAQQDNINETVHTLHHHVEKQGLATTQLALWNASVQSYAFFWNHYFKKQHDTALLLGQDNILCYVPHSSMTFRIQPNDDLLDAYRVLAAALTCDLVLQISGEKEKIKDWVESIKPKLNAKFSVIYETELQFIQRIKENKIMRLRFLTLPGSEILKAASQAACNKNIGPVLANGRVELLHYLREVCISYDYHRYGNLGLRENDKRQPLKDPEKCVDKSSVKSSSCVACCCEAM